MADLFVRDLKHYFHVLIQLIRLFLPVPELPPGVDDVDRKTDDVFFCPDYSSDVIEYQHQKEVKFKLPENFLEGTEVAPHMRSVLVDWLTQVQVKIKFSILCCFAIYRLISFLILF